MSSKVLHGVGKPKIITESGGGGATGIIGSVVVSGDNTLIRDDIPSLWIKTIIGQLFVSENALNEATEGIIIDAGSYDITATNWSNGVPVVGKSFSIIAYEIDLPYCNTLTEIFTPIFGPTKTRYSNKKKIRKLLGFYYIAILDYSDYIDADVLKLLKDIFNSARTLNFNFYPRGDNPAVKYLCEISPDADFQFAQLKYNQGHKGVIIELGGLELLSKIPFLD